MEEYNALERERLINSTIELYGYLFGALFGSELSYRQDVIFRYLARLMMVVPGATIHTLMRFLQNPEAARPYVKKLDHTAQLYFEDEFFGRDYDDSRHRIVAKLFHLLSNNTLAR